MQWFSRVIRRYLKSAIESGWHLDKLDEDYNILLVCKECSHKLPIKDCQKKYIVGSSKDSDSIYLFSLHCTKCGVSLALLNESEGDFRPKLILEECGRFARDPRM